MLPVALLALSSCVLPWCRAIKLGVRGRAIPRAPEEAKWMSWWEEGQRNQLLKIRSLPGLSNESTAIVTHAGKNNQEFIDMAVMLGVSLTRHLPEYPKIALGIKGMSDDNQEALKGAGWHVVLVGGWRAPAYSFNMCGDSCADDEFILRFQDSWERLNAFRLPVGRVLYLDADTYVANDDLLSVIKYDSFMPTAIGMVPSSYLLSSGAGCETGFNSGVMLFRPDLDAYRSMMRSVAEMLAGNATKRSDEQIINSAYQGRIFKLDKKFNCLEEKSDACSESCTDVAVSHFNGLPKPASADVVRFSGLGVGGLAAAGSNTRLVQNDGPKHLSLLSTFYCDLLDNKELLTKPLQSVLRGMRGHGC